MSDILGLCSRMHIVLPLILSLPTFILGCEVENSQAELAPNAPLTTAANFARSNMCLWQLFRNELPWERFPLSLADELNRLLSDHQRFAEPPTFAVAAERFRHVKSAFLAGCAQAQSLDLHQHGLAIVHGAAWEMEQLWNGAQSSPQLRDPACPAFLLVDQLRLFINEYSASFQSSADLARTLALLEDAIYDAWLAEQSLLARYLDPNWLHRHLTGIRQRYAYDLHRKRVAAILAAEIRGDLPPNIPDAQVIINAARSMIVDSLAVIAIRVEPPAKQDPFLFPQGLSTIGVAVVFGAPRIQVRLLPANDAVVQNIPLSAIGSTPSQ